MRELGLVVNVEANNAYVQIDRKTACESCKACGLGTSDEKSIIVQAINNIKAQKGDIVELDLESPDVLLAAFIIYGIPLLALILGIFASYGVMKAINYNSEILMLLTGVVFMIISFIIIRLNEPKLKESKKFSSTVVEIKGKSLI